MVAYGCRPHRFRRRAIMILMRAKGIMFEELSGADGTVERSRESHRNDDNGQP
jgi:hypothetical protein